MVAKRPHEHQRRGLAFYNSLEAALFCNAALKQGSGRKIVDELAAQDPLSGDRRPEVSRKKRLGVAFVPLPNVLGSLDMSRP
jgi:hypothetical protein